MSGVNRVILLGRLGKDPELKNINGMALCNFSIATSKQWKDESGEKQERTQWHDLVCFKKTAEIAAKYLSKGRQVYIEGELNTRTWDDKDTGAKRYRTEIIVNSLQFVGEKSNGSDAVNTVTGPQDDQPLPTENEDIPF